MTNCSFQWQSFPFPWKCAALKTLLQQGSSCQPHLLVETRCFRVQSNKSQLMQVPNGKDTESTRPDSQVSVPSTRPGTWESPAWSWASSPLRKEKEKRNHKTAWFCLACHCQHLRVWVRRSGKAVLLERFLQRYDSTWFPSKDLEQLKRLLSPSWCRV